MIIWTCMDLSLFEFYLKFIECHLIFIFMIIWTCMDLNLFELYLKFMTMMYFILFYLNL